MFASSVCTTHRICESGPLSAYRRASCTANSYPPCPEKSEHSAAYSASNTSIGEDGERSQSAVSAQPHELHSSQIAKINALHVKSRLFLNGIDEELRLVGAPSAQRLNGRLVLQSALRDEVVVGHQIVRECDVELGG